MSITTYTSWNLRIGNKAYSGIVPKEMTIFEEKSSMFSRIKALLFKERTTPFTGRWAIKITYNNGPSTLNKSDTILFNTETEARYWYDGVFQTVFVKTSETFGTPPPRSPTSPKNKSGLRLL